MAIPLLICDDSNMARRQLVKALPEGWDVSISYASNGLEALAAIRQGKGEMVFLDLTMPELDGFGVLKTIREEDLKSLVIVISGDIQPLARDRVMQLGAIDFIKKPVSQEKLRQTLETFGLL
jgi:two-component system chemotaxis response regulator CheY